MDWEARYKEFGDVFGEEPSKIFANNFQEFGLEARFNENDSVIFPGDGYGRNGLWLAQTGCQVDAFDISPTASQGANFRANSQHLKYCSVAVSSAGYMLPDKPLYAGVFHVWFRIENIQERVSWNERVLGSLIPGAVIFIVTSTRINSSAAEFLEWPSSVKWGRVKIDDENLIIMGEFHPAPTT